MIEDIEFGKWLSIKTVQTVIDKHLRVEDIYTIEGNRESEDNCRKFYEEILPICNYANRKGGTEVFLVDDHIKDNSFDGIIKLTNGEIISIECTNAILPKDAIAQKERDKECRSQHITSLPFQSIEVNQYRKNIANIIKQAIQKKIEKSKKNPDKGKYKDFHLIVTLIATDFIWSCENDIKQAIENFIKPMNISPFAKVIFYKKIETGYPIYAGEIY